MDRLLTADAGNSTLDLFDHGRGERLRLDAAAIDAAGLTAWLDRARPTACVATSVRVGGLDALFVELRRIAVPCRIAGVDLPCPLPLDYATPHTLGADRWLGALAAHGRFGRAVVVDCGSATTVNLVAADGTFRGGPIAPGLRAFVAGMGAVTPALPGPQLDAAVAMPPASSQAAVDAGVLLGYAGLVERLVAEALRVVGGPATVVATGGNCDRLLRYTRLRPVVVPDLVHQGLRSLAARSP